MEELLYRIGQLFVIGFPGEEPPGPFLDFVGQHHMGGFILFEENCPTHTIVRRNIDTLLSCCITQPIIAIDQEGGRVCRLRGTPVEYGSAASYAQEDDTGKFAIDYAASVGYLKETGINLNLSPVADIFLDDKNSCLDGRCFGVTPEQVSKFVRVSVTVGREVGILNCLKHFPGLGAAAVDPHEDTAIADYDEETWKKREKIPFAAGLAAGAQMVMSTHLLLPKIDDKIVTGSSKIISTLLRKRLGFNGVVLTDDLCMAGAAALGDIGDVAVAAFKAGHDLLLFGKEFEKTQEAYHRVVEAVRSGEIDIERVEQSLKRVTALKQTLSQSVVS